MQASTVIARALRLINVPGRGAILGPTDQADAFTTLQDILNSESVSKWFNPGIRRHFFPTIAAQSIYSYGPGPGTDFDTRDFDDPTIVRVEDTYIRTGSQIVVNELVGNDRFDDNTIWTVNAGWVLTNSEAQASAATGTLEQTINNLTIGEVYTVKVDIGVFQGDVTLDFDTLGIVIAATSNYSFSFTATAVSALLSFTPNGVTFFTGTVNEVSVRLQSTPERTSLVGTGSDYRIEIIDQKHYNDRFSKGTGGRPYQMLFSRPYPNAELRFDNAPSGPSDILVMDVTVNRVSLMAVSDDIRMHDDAIKWLRYQLAYEMAPEYGKVLPQAAEQTRREAEARLFSGNFRRNTLRVDFALRRRRTFDINRGDP